MPVNCGWLLPEFVSWPETLTGTGLTITGAVAWMPAAPAATIDVVMTNCFEPPPRAEPG